MATTAWAFLSTVRTLRAAIVAIALWSSELAEVGIESTLAGWVRTLFSETIPAAAYCTIISPELIPRCGIRFEGRLRFWWPSSSIWVRRSEMFASSATAIARTSAAMPTGSPWKLPAENEIRSRPSYPAGQLAAKA